MATTSLWLRPTVRFRCAAGRNWSAGRAKENKRKTTKEKCGSLTAPTQRSLPCFTGFCLCFFYCYSYRIVFYRFYRLLSSFSRFLLGCTGFYLVLPSFIWFYWVLQGLTGFCLCFFLLLLPNRLLSILQAST